MENFALGRGATPDEIGGMTQDSKKRKLSKWLLWCGCALVAVLMLEGVLWFDSASSRIRNTAIEKAMMGEARQISSAANQIMAETHRDAIGFPELGSYIQGMSSGMTVSADGVVFTGGDYRKTTGLLRKAGYFYVRSPEWSRSRSRIDAERLAKFAVDEHTMKFEVETGAQAGTFR